MPVIDMTDPKQREDYLKQTFGYTDPPKYPYQKPDTSNSFTIQGKKVDLDLIRIPATRAEEV